MIQILTDSPNRQSAVYFNQEIPLDYTKSNYSVKAKQLWIKPFANRLVADKNFILGFTL